MPEGNPLGLRLGAVAAIDADDGENGHISYSLETLSSNSLDRIQETGVLSIDHNSGEIRATTVFDREMRERYEFRVFAEDAGTPQLTATTSITLIVADRNDNPPQWNSSLSFSVRENERARVELGTLRAFDRDVGENARLTYRLADRSSDGRFEVDPQRGTLFATGALLDREQEEVVQLHVCTSDSGSPRLETCALAIVRVLDENDNDPYFVFPQELSRENCSIVINASIHSPVGFEIWKLHAEDKDSGTNAEVSYRIASGNENHLFQLGHTIGSFAVFRPIPVESINTNTRLQIIVSDKGVPPRETEATLCVQILEDSLSSSAFAPAIKGRYAGRNSNPQFQGDRSPSGSGSSAEEARWEREWQWVEMLENQTWFFVFLAVSALVFIVSFACSVALIARRLLDRYNNQNTGMQMRYNVHPPFINHN